MTVRVKLGAGPTPIYGSHSMGIFFFKVSNLLGEVRPVNGKIVKYGDEYFFDVDDDQEWAGGRRLEIEPDVELKLDKVHS